MTLPLLSWLFAIFALSLYVLLDGFDLGVGVLLLCQRDEGLRDRTGVLDYADMGWQ